MVNPVDSAKGRREFGDHPMRQVNGRAARRKLERTVRKAAKKQVVANRAKIMARKAK